MLRRLPACLPGGRDLLAREHREVRAEHAFGAAGHHQGDALLDRLGVRPSSGASAVHSAQRHIPG